MTLQEKHAYLNDVYQKSLDSGLCHNAKQFAELLGIDRSGLYPAMNGKERFLTDSLIKKVQIWAQLNLADKKVKEPSEMEITILNLSETIKNLSETIRSQQELISQLQGAHTQKKIG